MRAKLYRLNFEKNILRTSVFVLEIHLFSEHNPDISYHNAGRRKKKSFFFCLYVGVQGMI